MSPVQIKICGISRPEEVDGVNRAEPDYAGFVFAPSRRRVTEELAGELRKRLSPTIRTVGVFVGPTDPETVLRLADHGVIGLAQLHGEWEPDQIALLRDRGGFPLIRAISIRSEEDLAEVESREDWEFDTLLLDGPAPGSGRRFDWRYLEGRRFAIPFFLAGGITIGNLDRALAVQPSGIDLSSGVESDGVKDPAKMIEITRRVRESQRRNQ